MGNFNGYTYTNLSSTDTLHNPDSWINPANAMDDNDSTQSTLTTTSAGTEETKVIGTTFSSATIVMVRIKASVDMNLGASSYSSQYKLQAYNGTSWIDVQTLDTVSSQTHNIDTLVRTNLTCQGLRLVMVNTVDSGNDIDRIIYTFSYATSFTYTPKFLLSELGGTDIESLNDMTAIAEDHTLTWRTILRAGSFVATQNAYQILQANNIFENKDNVMADEFVDSNGTNNTVNTGSSTAIFDNSNSLYKLGFTDEAGSDTLHNPSSFTSTSNLFDSDDNTYSSKAFSGVTGGYSTQIGTTFPAKYVSSIRVKVRVAMTGGNFSGTQNIYIQTYDGATWTNHTTIFSNTANGLLEVSGTYDIDSNIQGIRVNNSLNLLSGSDGNISVYYIEYGDYDTSSTILIDSNSLTLDGNENNICVYSDADIPANTSLSVIAGDGTNISSAVTLNTTSKTAIIDITGLTTGTLELTFTLSTTDTTVSPLFRGYSVSLIR